MPELPIFFDRYITKVEDMPLMEAFEQFSPSAILSDLAKVKALGDQVYAPGKWTVRDILQHIIDTERILSYRTLRFARNDKTVLSGFEEDDFAKNTDASNRNMDNLLEEWNLLRASNLALFKSFTTEMLYRKGTSYKVEISVLALGFVIIGHPIHHYRVLEERYFPLLDQ